MPRAPRRHPPAPRRPKRSSAPEATFFAEGTPAAGGDAAEEPRMISSDEKRELILAHAQARTSPGHGWGLGYYVAIAASCLVVVTGWWMTAGINLRTGVAPRDQLLEGLSQNLHGPSSLLSATGTSVIKSDVDAIKQQLQVKSDASNAPSSPSTTSTAETNPNWFDDFWRQAAGGTSTESGSGSSSTGTTSPRPTSIR